MADDWESRRAIKDAKRLVFSLLGPVTDEADWLSVKIVDVLVDAGWSPNP